MSEAGLLLLLLLMLLLPFRLEVSATSSDWSCCWWGMAILRFFWRDEERLNGRVWEEDVGVLFWPERTEDRCASRGD